MAGERDESTETSGFEPTVIENATLGLSQLDKDLVDEAIRQGLITTVQGQMVLESVVSTGIGGTSGGTETVGLMVDRGLIPKDKAEELLDALTEEFVPGYRLGRELGRGAMGVVYEATQKKLGRRVALKVVNPALSQNADYVKRFKREAQTLAKLNHPNIVQLYDFGEANGRIFLALEFVEGEDVTNYMQREGQVPEALALQITRDVARGLGHGHQSGVIHRDVKPANLLLLKEGEGYVTKITDFGLAREQEHKGDGELTQEGTILGTPAYMAPEQTEGVKACHKCDIYALGATLYHMLTGTVPFQASSVVSILLKKQTERLENPQIRASDLSSQAVQVLDRMLARTASERYQDYTSLLTDLDLVIQGAEPEISPLPREHSSLHLGALVQTEVRQVKLPTGRLAPVAETRGGGLGPVIAVIVVVLILVGGYFAWRAKPTPTPTPPASPSVAVLPQPSRSESDLVEAKLKALESVPAKTLAGQVEVLAELQAMIEKLPEGERDLLSIRQRALVDTALSASQDEALTALNKAWRAGDYERLAELVAGRKKLAGLAEAELVEEFAAHAKRSAKAGQDGAGQAERALWGEIEAAWKESPRDINLLLAKLKQMQDYVTFSPEAETVSKRILELESSAPVVKLTPVPASATLTLDGKEQAKGSFEGRLSAGEHRVQAKAEGYRDYDLKFDLRGRLIEELHLAPLRKAPLKGDPAFVTERRRPVLNPRIDLTKYWTQEGGEWALRGSKNIKELPNGLDGTGSPAGASVITRPFEQTCLGNLWGKGGKGWSLKWQMYPFQGSTSQEGKSVVNPVSEAQSRAAAAELRILSSPEGQLVVGFDRGRVYVGLRKGDALYLRWSEAYPKGPPEWYQISWDGDVAEVYVKADGGFRFFHSVRLEDASEETLSLAVLGGRVLFTNFGTPEVLVPAE